MVKQFIGCDLLLPDPGEESRILEYVVAACSNVHQLILYRILDEAVLDLLACANLAFKADEIHHLLVHEVFLILGGIVLSSDCWLGLTRKEVRVEKGDWESTLLVSCILSGCFILKLPRWRLRRVLIVAILDKLGRWRLISRLISLSIDMRFIIKVRISFFQISYLRFGSSYFLCLFSFGQYWVIISDAKLRHGHVEL
jgi:hypothetical protein